jgi:hypothetical protein
METDMASQVISGTSNPSYTNSTGKNVRIIFNFLSRATSVNWAGASANASSGPLPAEIMLASNQTFSAICGPYNIVVVKEDGT